MKKYTMIINLLIIILFLIGCKGEDGADGRDADYNKITEAFYCSGTISSVNIAWYYKVWSMTSGDVFAEGGILTTASQSSSANFYSADANGNALAPVYIRNDVVGINNNGDWKIYLDRTTNISILEYTDPSIGIEAVVYEQTSDKCFYNSY